MHVLRDAHHSRGIGSTLCSGHIFLVSSCLCQALTALDVYAERLLPPNSLVTPLPFNAHLSSHSSSPTASSISSYFRNRWTQRRLSQSLVKKHRSLSQMGVRFYCRMCTPRRRPICSRTDPGQQLTSNTLASCCLSMAYV